MAVYRSDQAQLTFAAEAAQGADMEMMEGSPVSSGASSTLNATFAAGDRSITVANGSSFLPGDFIRIGTVAGTVSQTVAAHEVRRIEFIDAGAGTVRTFILDRPLGFGHATSQEVIEISAIGGSTGTNDENKYITFTPGVYETVDTPDPEMSIEGRRFLGTQSKRNWSVAYPGQQTLSGSISDIMLLNGWPLRFPFGSVVTTPEDTTGSTHTIATTAVVKGDIYITLSSVSGISIGDYINIGLGSTSASEVRKVVGTPSGQTLKLNYPCQFDHAIGVSVKEVDADYYTHEIHEKNDLDTVSWHVHMKESSETAGKDFDRRYFGGMIGSATLSAEEGEMLSMSWDSVNFLNFAHNQRNQITLATGGSNAPQAGDLYYAASITANMPRFGLMQSIDTSDVGEPDKNDGTGLPSTQPYYFSQGSLQFFGQEFARVRSFSLSVSNGEEPRYYLGRQGNRARGPYEIKEGQREYSLSASVVLPDATIESGANAATAVQSGALELFKQLLLEGDFGGTTQATARTGLTMTLRFDRGVDDWIIIDVPGSATAGSPTAGSNALNSQGLFINTAPHTIGNDNPFQVDIDAIFRSIKIRIRDTVPVYP